MLASNLDKPLSNAGGQGYKGVDMNGGQRADGVTMGSPAYADSASTEDAMENCLGLTSNAGGAGANEILHQFLHLKVIMAVQVILTLVLQVLLLFIKM